jgi:hypothetical protein
MDLLTLLQKLIPLLKNNESLPVYVDTGNVVLPLNNVMIDESGAVPILVLKSTQ